MLSQIGRRCRPSMRTRQDREREANSAGHSVRAVAVVVRPIRLRPNLGSVSFLIQAEAAPAGTLAGELKPQNQPLAAYSGTD
jgi:hypothetical protein